MNKAQRIVESLLEGTTVIIVNNGGGNDGPGDDLQNIVRQISTGGQDVKSGMSASGKKWNFRVQRDSGGSITNIEAQEA